MRHTGTTGIWSIALTPARLFVSGLLLVAALWLSGPTQAQSPSDRGICQLPTRLLETDCARDGQRASISVLRALLRGSSAENDPTRYMRAQSRIEEAARRCGAAGDFREAERLASRSARTALDEWLREGFVSGLQPEALSCADPARDAVLDALDGYRWALREAALQQGMIAVCDSADGGELAKLQRMRADLEGRRCLFVVETARQATAGGLSATTHGDAQDHFRRALVAFDAAERLCPASTRGLINAQIDGIAETLTAVDSAEAGKVRRALFEEGVDRFSEFLGLQRRSEQATLRCDALSRQAAIAIQESLGLTDGTGGLAG